jgi:periplasmic copper chaperone A
MEMLWPSARETAAGASVGGPFLAIVNKGSTADRLLANSTFAADTARLHRAGKDNEVAKMNPIVAFDVKGDYQIAPASGG